MKITAIAMMTMVLFMSSCSHTSNTGKVRASSWGAKTQKFQAVLKAKNGKPAFVATIDFKGQAIQVKRLAPKPLIGKSYELWSIVGTNKDPSSLGVVDNSKTIQVRNASDLSGATLAVSLERKGGSPTGKVGGPVLYTGKVKRVAARSL